MNQTHGSVIVFGIPTMFPAGRIKNAAQIYAIMVNARLVAESKELYAVQIIKIAPPDSSAYRGVISGIATEG